MSLPFTVASQGQLQKRLQTMRSAWKGQKISSTLKVSPELSFWYWLEFGTAARGEKGGANYTIRPIDSDYLVFPSSEGLAFRTSVSHPGIKPRRMVRRVHDEIRAAVRKRTAEAFLAGAADNPHLLSNALHQAVLDAKALIVESIAATVTGTRPVNPEFPKQSGKLVGKTAASVFEADATVVDA